MSVANATPRPAAAEGGSDQIDEIIIVQHLVDRSQLGIPELPPVGQQHLEDAELRIRATDDKASIEIGRLRCAVDWSGSESITHHDGGTRTHVSRELSVLSLAGRGSPPKMPVSAVSFAPGSS